MGATMADQTNQVDFVWEGLNKSKEKSKGEISARNEAIAKVELRKQGIRVTKIGKKPKPLFGKKKAPITTGDIALFARQLATMLSSGIALVQAIDIVGKGHDNPSMQELLMGVKTEIEGGERLGTVLRRRPMQFDELFCNLVEAGEQAGVLETLLDKIATYKEKTESMRKKIKKALTYPIAVIVVAFVVTTILLLFVVPVFEDMFKNFGADLPGFTQMVVNMSKWLQEYWYMLFGIIGGLVFSFTQATKRVPAFNRFLERLSLKLPIIGVIVNKSAIARFARTLATMSAAGVPLIEALESVAGACGNIVYYDTVMQMRNNVANGHRLQFCMSQGELWPNMVQQMVSIGEEAGTLDNMLSRVADYFEEEVDNLVDNLASLMEPIIMAILGVLVGGLVVAMYLPIFKMGSVV